MFVERVVWKAAFTLISSFINIVAYKLIVYIQTCSFELAGETKNRSKLWEFEIADSKGVKGKSKGNGCEFEITRNLK